MSFAWLLGIVFATSALGTGMLRRYAITRRIVDIPNERSSHLVPTPRGGGISVVLAFLIGTVALTVSRLVDPLTAVALVGAGALAAAVGFVDDHRPIPARWRLLVHFVAAAWALAWLGGLPPVQLVGSVVNLGWPGNVLATIALVWLLNLYNFMDGIDGLAGLEAVTVCFGAVLLHFLQPSGDGDWVLESLLAAAALGFLVWNFPRAKIFMGDAGSGFLGLTLGVLAIRESAVSPSWLWSWIILLGVFVVDATVTLLRRLRRGDRVYEAHRNHAYQHAAMRARSHLPVTFAVGAINLLWLLPLALLAGTGRLSGALAAVIAYAPLAWLAVRLRAGTPPR